jgi:hypothetical protein
VIYESMRDMAALATFLLCKKSRKTEIRYDTTMHTFVDHSFDQHLTDAEILSLDSYFLPKNSIDRGVVRDPPRILLRNDFFQGEGLN